MKILSISLTSNWSWIKKMILDIEWKEKFPKYFNGLKTVSFYDSQIDLSWHAAFHIISWNVNQRLSQKIGFYITILKGKKELSFWWIKIDIFLTRFHMVLNVMSKEEKKEIFRKFVFILFFKSIKYSQFSLFSYHLSQQTRQHFIEVFHMKISTSWIHICILCINIIFTVSHPLFVDQQTKSSSSNIENGFSSKMETWDIFSKLNCYKKKS